MKFNLYRQKKSDSSKSFKECHHSIRQDNCSYKVYKGSQKSFKFFINISSLFQQVVIGSKMFWEKFFEIKLLKWYLKRYINFKEKIV